MKAGDPSAPRAGRRDAERNRAALVAAAITTLAEDPTASMDRVAVAAGVGRATLYRHFPGREDLVGAILERVVNEAHATTERVLAEGAPPRETLGALARELALLGERFRFMAVHRVEVATAQARMEPRSSDALESYVQRLQKEGALGADTPPGLVGDLLRGVLTSLMDAVSDGRVAPDDAPGLAERWFLGALGL